MKKLLVFALAMGVMLGMAALSQGASGGNKAQSNTAADAPLKTIKGTVKFDGDKATFVADEGGKSWDVMNPEALKGHDGHHVSLRAHVYEDKGTIHVMSVKMIKASKMKM
jgi:hypothetical protein